MSSLPSVCLSRSCVTAILPKAFKCFVCVCVCVCVIVVDADCKVNFLLNSSISFGVRSICICKCNCFVTDLDRSTNFGLVDRNMLHKRDCKDDGVVRLCNMRSGYVGGWTCSYGALRLESENNHTETRKTKNICNVIDLRDRAQQYGPSADNTVSADREDGRQHHITPRAILAVQAGARVL